jgi:peptidoglycan/LPS O-acetylase OafA/YrhL
MINHDAKQINKFENVQALRGIAVMLVVFFHLVIIEKKYGHGLIILPNFLNIGSAGVDVFFVISGFIMATITRGQFQQLQGIWHFLFNRITRIYPLYWFYSSLALIVFLLHPNWVNQSQHHQVDVIKSFLLLPQNNLPLLEVGWTLIHEMYFYFVITFLLFLPEKKFINLLGLWLSFIFLTTTFLSLKSPSMKIITNPLTCEFIAGCLIARSFYGNKGYNYAIFISGIIILLLGFGIFNFIRPNQIPIDWTRICLFGIPSIMMVYAGVGLEFNAAIFPSFLRKLGDASYSIYLSHILVFSALGRIWATIRNDNIIFHLLALTAMVAAVIIFGLISYYYLETPLIFYFRKIKLKHAVLDVGWIRRKAS